MSAVELYADDPVRRRAAIRRAGAEHRYALRAVLWHDEDGRLRALAAERLGAVGRVDAEEITSWLVEALGDALPSVRDEALRAMARLGGVNAIEAARRASIEEPVWWVRRSAVFTLATLAGAEEIPSLRAALGDPFWRVRHGAMQALEVIGDATPSLRAVIAAPFGEGAGNIPGAAALGLLRRRWGLSSSGAVLAAVGDEVEAVGIAPERERAALPPEIADADPAVVTARLDALPAGAVPALSLVPLLADAHEALARVAAARIASSGELAALVAVTRWLEEPRFPHASRTARALLDGLGEPARAVVEEVLKGDEHGPGALRWAIEWSAAVGADELHEAIGRHAKHSNAGVRAAVARAIVRLSSNARVEIFPFLLDEDAVVRGVAIEALAGDRTPATMRALGGIDPVAQVTSARGVLVELAAATGDVARLRRALGDPHPAVRAVAVAGLVNLGELTTAERDARLDDPDPIVRIAALAPDLEPARIVSIARDDLDPRIQARAASLLDPADDEGLRVLLRLSRAAIPFVRAVAEDRVASLSDQHAHLRRLLANTTRPLDETARAAAYAFLLRAHDHTAAAVIEGALARGDEPPAIVAELRAHAILLPSPIAGIAPLPVENAPAVRPRRAAIEPAPIARRPLGRTGILVAPLAISGAHGLQPGSLSVARAAGANLFFWEPSHAGLTRFLRAHRRDALVACGTYHADAASIERDVVRALRLLRRDALDVFLLFWARSPARLSGEAFATLARLRERGLVRAIGFSTHDRALAATAIVDHPWDVLMTRHSAAHPGAEAELLPLAAERGTGVLSFSALCYGRLLGETAAGAAPSPADCYRYSLAQPAVAACISAPRRHRELVENLAVLADPVLAPGALAHLCAVGAAVRDDNRRWNALVRQAEGLTREAAAAALARLAAERPPELDAAADDRRARHLRRLPARRRAFG